MTAFLLELTNKTGILVNGDNIIKAAAVVTAFSVLVGVIVKVTKYFTSRTIRIETLEQRTDEIEKGVKLDRQENELLMEGILACLDGLEQQGCNHTVPLTKEKISKYINERAHK